MSRGQQKQVHNWRLEFHKIKPTRPAGEELPNPPGYYCMANSKKKLFPEPPPDPKLFEKSYWKIALSPLYEIPMAVLGAYMVPNSFSIFPMMMVGMLFYRSIQALRGLPATFAEIRGNVVLLKKAIYLTFQLIILGVGIFKCYLMELIPHPSDWLAITNIQQRMEWSGGGAIM